MNDIDKTSHIFFWFARTNLNLGVSIYILPLSLPAFQIYSPFARDSAQGACSRSTKGCSKKSVKEMRFSGERCSRRVNRSRQSEDTDTPGGSCSGTGQVRSLHTGQVRSGQDTMYNGRSACLTKSLVKFTD